jgi:hypothetical protein
MSAMDFPDLSTDRLHESACYFAAGEAARRTPYRIALHEEERRYVLEINGRTARVFSRRTAATRPMRRGTGQDVDGAHSLVFVDLSGPTPAFYITPPDVAVGEVEQWLGRWDRFN